MIIIKKLKPKALALLLMGIVGAAGCQKAPQDWSALEKHCESLRLQQKAASLSVAVVRADSLLWLQSFGEANRETGRAADPHTPYLLASVSKTFTGVAAMRAVEEGKLDLDADINTYMPFAVRNPLYPSNPITCRQLLTHTSSIQDAHYNSVSENFYYYNQDPAMNLADFCRALFQPSGTYYDERSFATTAPGSLYSYSNLAYALLGYVIERAVGQPFDEYTEQRIFAPLGMSETSWWLSDLDTATLAMPYSTDGVPQQHYTFADYPNGGLRSSASDLSKYMRMILNNGSFNGQQILSAASVDAMRQVQFPDIENADGQGLSFYYQYLGERELLGHSGGETGVSTEFYYDTETGIGAIVLWNDEAIPNPKAERLLGYLLDAGEW